MTTQNTSVDPYTAARTEWTERYSDFIYATIFWRRIAFGAIGVAGILAGGLIAVAMQAKTVPFVVQVDGIGTISGAGPAEAATFDDQILYRAQLATFLRDWRTVVGDRSAQKGFVEKAHATVRGAATERLREAYAAASPFDVMQKQTVELELLSILVRGEDTLEAIWRERSRTLEGRPLGLRYYRGVFEFERDADADPNFLNPLAIFVERFSFTEERR